MAPQEKINYFKLVALIADIACLVIWQYIRENILGKDSFETFLNKKKHTLVHLYETLPCCECIVSKKINGERLVSRKQFLVLYKSIDRNKVYYHNKYACRKLTQICTCNYSANDNVDVKVVDITLANYIIKRCGKREQGVDNWIEQIKDVRNKIFHLSDIQKITDHKFNRIWTQLEGSILGIANLMGSVYVDEIEKKILQTKEHIFISSYMLKYEKLCCDYWRNKCAEFERAQIQVFEKKTEALHMKDPKVFSKSMEKDCQKTMEEIRKFRTYVNNINILIKVFGKTEDVNTLLVNEDIQRVPVFLQLELPASWSRTKVLEYLEEMRINETSEMNLRIIAVSPDDLNLYSEIAKTVLSKVDLLKDEVQKLLSGMLLEAVINSKESAEVGFNVTIPTITEETSQINSDDEHGQAEQPDHPSAIHDCKTRTEFNEETCQINGDDKHDKAEKADHPAIHDCKTRTDFDEGTSQINSDDEHDQAEKADHPSAIHDCKTRTEFDGM
ncbi:uncharacterized protein LOC143057394 [Mytilus galloprovincialis]|uniref:uncharacterized protein LOC143057394 n=1 Tax=Mytilus galloprovincialis TaxID=29158 RepID=UPI003F7C98D2